VSLEQIDGHDVIRWAQVLAPARQIAEVVAPTDFVPKAMRDQPDVVTAAIMYGDEIGVRPMQALAGIHVVEGRPSPSAELMRALILRAGHSLAVHDMSGTRCRVSGLRAGRPESERLTVEWTLDMARAAGLLGRPVGQRYPRAMLLARATSDLARILFPDAVKGLGYLAEDEVTASELESWAPFGASEPAPPEQPARQPVQRRTSPRVRELTTSPALPEPPEQQHEPEAQPAHENAPESPAEPPELPPDPIDQPVRSMGGQHAARPPEVEPLDAPVEASASAAVPSTGAEAGPAQVMPDLEPEQPAPEPPAEGAGPVRISDGIRRGLLISWRKIAEDVDSDAGRLRRLELFGHLIRRKIDSTRELTRAEGWTIAQALGRIEDGDAALIETPEGWYRIRDWPDITPSAQPDEEDASTAMLPPPDDDGVWT
jgi:hypothetical protein